MIIKQPNGRYMRFSSVVDCPTHWNLTEEEMRKTLRQMYMEDLETKINIAIETAKDIKCAINSFVPNNMTDAEFKNILKECRKK